MKCVANNLIGVVIFIGIWHCSLGADAPPTSCAGKQLLDLLSKWRQGDTLPLPLPPIGEINIQSFEGQYAGYGIKMTFETGEMKLSGVNNFAVEELFVSASDSLQAAGSFIFPVLNVTTKNYNLKGRAYMVYSLSGSGPMYATFNNVKLLFKITLAPKGDGTQIKDIGLNFNVDRVKIDLASSSWPINKVLNAEGRNIIDSYHDTVIDAATEGLKNSLNRYLATEPFLKIMATFVGHCVL